MTATGTTSPYTIKFTVTGATPGATYYIGIKYSPQNLVGQTGEDWKHATSEHLLLVDRRRAYQPGSGTSIPVAAQGQVTDRSLYWQPAPRKRADRLASRQVGEPTSNLSLPDRCNSQ